MPVRAVAQAGNSCFDFCFSIFFGCLSAGARPSYRRSFAQTSDGGLNLILLDDLIFFEGLIFSEDLIIDFMGFLARSVGGRSQGVELPEDVGRFRREFFAPLSISVFRHFTCLVVKIEVANLLEERVLLGFQRLSHRYWGSSVGKRCLFG